MTPRPFITHIGRVWPHCVLVRLVLPGEGKASTYRIVDPRPGDEALRLAGDNGAALEVHVAAARGSLFRRLGVGLEWVGRLRAEDVFRLQMHLFDSSFASGNQAARNVWGRTCM